MGLGAGAGFGVRVGAGGGVGARIRAGVGTSVGTGVLETAALDVATRSGVGVGVAVGTEVEMGLVVGVVLWVASGGNPPLQAVRAANANRATKTRANSWRVEVYTWELAIVRRARGSSLYR